MILSTVNSALVNRIEENSKASWLVIVQKLMYGTRRMNRLYLKIIGVTFWGEILTINQEIGIQDRAINAKTAPNTSLRMFDYAYPV